MKHNHSYNPDFSANGSSTEQPLAVMFSAEKGKRPQLKIEGTIYGWGEKERYVKDNLAKAKADGATEIDLYLNGPGGDCFEANEIVNALKESGLEVHGRSGALLASAYTYIAINCASFKVASNAQCMIHKPIGSLRGNEDQIESYLRLLKNLTEDYKSSYSGRSGKSVEHIESLWGKGDYWMNADQFINEGFADAKSTEPAKITKSDALMIAACGCPVKIEANTIESNQNPNNDMPNFELNASMVGLPATATMEEISAAFEAMKVKAAKADNLLKQIQDDAAAKLAADIKSILDTAETDKRIKPEERSDYQAMLESNFDVAKRRIEALTPIPKLSAQINPGKTETPKGREKWTYEDWSDKDPEGLMAMAESEDPNEKAKFEALYKAYVG